MGKKLVTQINIASIIVKIYCIAPIDDLGNHSDVVKADGSDVIFVGTEADAASFASSFNHVIGIFLDIFPEVPTDEVLLDYGIASIDLIDRVGRLRELDIPITIVDVFEFLTPISIASQCALRLIREEYNEDF